MQRKAVKRWFFGDKQPAHGGSDPVAARFCRNARLVQVPHNTLIYGQGDMATTVFAVVGGAVELLRHEAPQPGAGNGGGNSAAREGASGHATAGNRRDSGAGIVPMPVVPEQRESQPITASRPPLALAAAGVAPASVSAASHGGVPRPQLGPNLWGSTGAMGPLVAETTESPRTGTNGAEGGVTAPAAAAGVKRAVPGVGASSSDPPSALRRSPSGSVMGRSVALLRAGDVFGQPVPSFSTQRQRFTAYGGGGQGQGQRGHGNNGSRHRSESVVSRPHHHHHRHHHSHSSGSHRPTVLLCVSAEGEVHATAAAGACVDRPHHCSRAGATVHALTGQCTLPLLSAAPTCVPRRGA